MWCVVCGVWCVVCGVWCEVCGVVCGVWGATCVVCHMTHHLPGCQQRRRSLHPDYSAAVSTRFARLYLTFVKRPVASFRFFTTPIFIAHTSHLTPHTSHLTPHTSHLTHLTLLFVIPLARTSLFVYPILISRCRQPVHPFRSNCTIRYSKVRSTLRANFHFNITPLPFNNITSPAFPSAALRSCSPLCRWPRSCRTPLVPPSFGLVN